MWASVIATKTINILSKHEVLKNFILLCHLPSLTSEAQGGAREQRGICSLPYALLDGFSYVILSNCCSGFIKALMPCHPLIPTSEPHGGAKKASVCMAAF